eukprot:CAMPEP_0179150600 /NCGR_PEP_ID=MMETSP0796-20121207/73053_1 /TAXON_ID=73915 /ORGANISM="Pyrodinium bahamense, Strain pbaha01" /LENGTH=53 /DNA_ID=CAMNT_0020851595 /DNA_START=29 /DNA_END=187 /DNA_ORIENTATION=-
MKYLDLTGNQISLEVMQGPIQLPTGLNKLVLRNNRIGDRGAAWLASGLPNGLA